MLRMSCLPSEAARSTRRGCLGVARARRSGLKGRLTRSSDCRPSARDIGGLAPTELHGRRTFIAGEDESGGLGADDAGDASTRVGPQPDPSGGGRARVSGGSDARTSILLREVSILLHLSTPFAKNGVALPRLPWDFRLADVSRLIEG